MTCSALVQILIKFQNGFDRQQLLSDSEPMVRLGVLSIAYLIYGSFPMNRSLPMIQIDIEGLYGIFVSKGLFSACAHAGAKLYLETCSTDELTDVR
jgi:hypothetical protein